MRGRARLLREHGERRVDPHRAERLLARRHRAHQHARRLLGEAVHGQVRVELLARRVRGRAHARLRHPVAEAQRLLRHPLSVGARRGHHRLELVVGDDAPLLEVDEEHAPRLEPPLGRDVRVGEVVEHTNLAREHHAPVVGHIVARGPQPVAVEASAQDLTVGEGHHRRPVPRLHQARVVLVEGAPVGRHVFVLPCLRHHHHDGLVDLPVARVDEQLGHSVEVA